LRVRNAEIEEEAHHFRESEENQFGRNSEAYEEVKSIIRSVRRERLQHETTVQTLEMQLQRAENDEFVAMERAREAEDSSAQLTNVLDEDLREAYARNAVLEVDRTNLTEELAAAQSQVKKAFDEQTSSLESRLQRAEQEAERQVLQMEYDAHERVRKASVELAQKEIDRMLDEKGRTSAVVDGQNRSIHHLEEQSRALESRLRQAEQNADLRVLQSECDAQERVHVASAEMEERARYAEKEISRIIDERDHASEMQAALNDEQDRSIRHLEDLLKEQNDQLRRERRDHSKAQLFEEQVAALRQQLHQEQTKFRASERTWAADRAALMTAVANSTNFAQQARPPQVGRVAGSRRKPTERFARSNTAGKAKLPSGNGNVGICPWHGHKPYTRAPVPACSKECCT
jgi:hypothetical protein